MLTVLMPVKNYHPEFFRKAIGSLLAQTSDAWRLIIVTERREHDEIVELVQSFAPHFTSNAPHPAFGHPLPTSWGEGTRDLVHREGVSEGTRDSLHREGVSGGTHDSLHRESLRPRVSGGEGGPLAGARGRLRPDEGAISIIRNEGRGLSGAFNTAMRAAETTFVAILLADDLWAPDAVETLARYEASFPETDFFHSARRIIDGNDAPLSSVHAARESFTRDDFLHTSPAKHLLCWRRELALSLGGMDESLPPVGPDDYDFPWSMFDAGARFQAVRECLYVYRDHRQAFRLTTHLPLDVHLQGIRLILEKHGVPSALVEQRLEKSKETYLRQCLYESRVDKAAKVAAGYDASSGWRDRYR